MPSRRLFDGAQQELGLLPIVATAAAGVDALTATGITTGTPTVGNPTLSSSSTTDNLTATGIATGAPTVGNPTLTVNGAVVSPPPTGGWEWLNTLNPPSRKREREPEDERKQPQPQRRVIRDPGIALVPDPIIERGSIPTVPAWDAMAELQRIQQEAAIARQERLRAIALADDDWLMMA